MSRAAAIVVPVRMMIGTRVLQSTSRALDMDGLFVRCVSPPLLGATLNVRLYLPDGPPEDIDCVVVPERELIEVGCRVKFISLTVNQRARLSRVVTPPIMHPSSPGKPAPKSPPQAAQPGAAPARAPLARIELRALTRVPAQIKVKFESVNAMAERLSLDISAGGMFVRMEQPPAINEEVQLLFSLPGDDAPPLSCRGLIVRRITPEEAKFTGRVAGAGVQFIDANDVFRERLDHWLANAQGLTPLDE